MDMFEAKRDEFIRKNAPLAERMRPRTLDEFIGQDHVIGAGRLLRRAIQIDRLSSLIFFGPPGTGKTTLARIIANTTSSEFVSINAVLAGVKDIRGAIEEAHKRLSWHSRRTILFIDEVHRFNKAQQDALLPNVENGVIILIGATTENPYFEVNKALVSRSRIFQLKLLSEDDLKGVAAQALKDKERGYGGLKVSIDDDALKHIVSVANGDARSVLNALELAVETTREDSRGVINIDRPTAEDSIQQRAVLYDKDGDVHYDVISAFIKSVRGSDPDAALYWLAKMVYAGEDPRFIFRRMLILASEDVGLADPRALEVVVSAARAFDYVGMPEGRYHLTHACLYLTTAQKSNSTMCFFDALDSVSGESEGEVPDPLKDASRDKTGLGHGKGYLYPHAYRDHWVNQQYLPDSLKGRLFYTPSDQGYEKEIKEDVLRRRDIQIAAMQEAEQQTPDVFKGGCSGESRLWIKRSKAGTNKLMSLVRDTVFKKAGIKPEDRVLDLSAGTGLLTFEALRFAKRGSVWAVALNSKDYDTVKGLSEKYPELERPGLIEVSAHEDIPEVLRRENGSDIKFEVIVGKDIFGTIEERAGFLRDVSALLERNGRLVLAETVHSRSQRISSLIEIEDKKLASEFVDSEKRLFSNIDDRLVNWSPEEIKSQWQKQKKEGYPELDFYVADYRQNVSFSEEDIEYFFRRAENGARRSLGDYLRYVSSNENADKIKQLIKRKLAGKEVEWKKSVCYFVLNN